MYNNGFAQTKQSHYVYQSKKKQKKPIWHLIKTADIYHHDPLDKIKYIFLSLK